MSWLHRLLRIGLSIAIGLNGFLAPWSMAHAAHSHATTVGAHAEHGRHDHGVSPHAGGKGRPACPRTCCDGVDCHCGCMMQVGDLAEVVTIVARAAPGVEPLLRAMAWSSAEPGVALRPPIT